MRYVAALLLLLAIVFAPACALTPEQAAAFEEAGEELQQGAERMRRSQRHGHNCRSRPDGIGGWYTECD